MLPLVFPYYMLNTEWSTPFCLAIKLFNLDGLSGFYIVNLHANIIVLYLDTYRLHKDNRYRS